MPQSQSPTQNQAIVPLSNFFNDSDDEDPIPLAKCPSAQSASFVSALFGGEEAASLASTAASSQGTPRSTSSRSSLYTGQDFFRELAEEAQARAGK
ncbi:hypothetical protein LTR08_008515 [Meristemomyces frigidus]|nr:hypothetical protein LTR08_008515 [Meristemomyces frigidus]